MQDDVLLQVLLGLVTHGYAGKFLLHNQLRKQPDIQDLLLSAKSSAQCDSRHQDRLCLRQAQLVQGTLRPE